MRTRTESEAQRSKRLQREARELGKWERIKTAPAPKHYFVVLMVVIAIIYCIDEITTNVCGVLQSPAIFDLFHITSQSVADPQYAVGINFLAGIGALGAPLMLIAPFYKALADKYGRRFFLTLNTCLFGVCLLIIATAPNIYVFAMGYVFSLFVTPNDVQVMYILEVAPKRHRAKIATTTKAIAILSISLMGVLRTVFYDPNNLSWWRNVCLVPMVIAAAAAVFAAVFARETPAFLNERIEYLRMTESERTARAAAVREEKSAERGGVINAVRFIFRHRQTRSIVLVALLFSVSSVYATYYETIMAGGLSVDDVSLAITLYPFAYAPITLISGFLSDRFGRKRSAVMLGVTTVLMLAAFILSLKLHWGPVVAGLAYGASLGGLWSAYDTIFFTITAESVPTNIRSSVMGTMNLLLIAGTVIGMALVVVGQNFFDMGWLCFAVCVPFMLVSMLLLIARVHETKDIDMETVTGTEWD